MIREDLMEDFRALVDAHTKAINTLIEEFNDDQRTLMIEIEMTFEDKPLSWVYHIIQSELGLSCVSFRFRNCVVSSLLFLSVHGRYNNYEPSSQSLHFIKKIWELLVPHP